MKLQISRDNIKIEVGNIVKTLIKAGIMIFALYESPLIALVMLVGYMVVEVIKIGDKI